MFTQIQDEPATERLLYIVSEKSGDFAHVKAHVVRRAQSTLTDQRLPCDGKDAKGYRNVRWSSGKKNALYVYDFTIQCQLTIGDRSYEREKKPYATKYHFGECYEVNYREAKRMVQTFEKLSKGMTSLHEQFGYIDDSDFAGYLLRIANILGIKTFLIKKPNYHNYDFSYPEAYREMKTSDIHFEIGRLIAELYPQQKETI